MSNHYTSLQSRTVPTPLPAHLRHTHGRYDGYLNARQGQSGHLWQGRYYSCPIDSAHLWMALRYVERNPVRERMVALPELQRRGALRRRRPRRMLDLDFWRAEWT